MTPNRIHQLDILRGIAILLVLGRHLPEGAEFMSGPLISICRFWYQIGWSGVDLFFVLSGFLVSGLLFREYQITGSVNLGRFLIRRGLRIWPAFYFMMALSLYFVLGKVSLSQIISELFFLQSYVPHIWKHTWTLAVEEHFYLFLGTLVWCLSRSKRPDPFGAIRWFWPASAGICLLLRILIPYSDMWPFARTHLRIDGLPFGVLLSYYASFHKEKLERWVREKWKLLAVIAAVLLSPILFLHLGREPFLPRFGLTFAYLGFGIWVLLAAFSDHRGERVDKGFLAWVGVRSYSIYLWHFPISFLAAEPLSRSLGGAKGLWMAIAVYLAGSITAGFFSHRWIEQPMLVWRDKRFPASKPVVNP